MPYKFPSILTINRINIDEDGNTLLTPAISCHGTLGALIQVSFGISAEGIGYDQNPETVFDRTFSFRWKYYTQQNSGLPLLSSSGFRLKTGTAAAAAAPMSFFGASAQDAVMNTNHSATLEVIDEGQILIVWRFYCTSEDGNFSPYFVNNINRLLASKNVGNYMELEAGSEFSVGSTGISIVATVTDGPETIPPSPPYISVTRGNTGNSKEFWMPLLMKWPGRNLGNTAYHMYLDTCEVTTIGGEVMATKTHKDTALPHQAKYDDNFWEFSASLSSFQDNFFRFKFSKGAVAAFTATSVRAFLLRTDSLTNEHHFLEDYRASIASIPTSDTTQAQISGDIYAPASYTNGTDYEVKFRVPGTSLEFGATYRAIVVMYGTTFSEIYSGISQELVANHQPNIYPKAEVYFADYFKESVQPKGVSAYHSGYRSRIEILKSSVEDAFAYYGLTGNFDDNVQYVRADYVKPSTNNSSNFTPQDGQSPFEWNRSSGLVSGQDYINTFEYLLGAFTDFIDEELLAMADEVESVYYITIQWEIGIEFTLPNGGTNLLKCQYRQYVVARRWESEANQPEPPPFTLEMKLYRSDGVTEIMDGSKYVCGSPTILALVEKMDVLAGGGLDAYVIPETYAETNTDGDTTAANIKQRRGAFLGYLPAATNPAIIAFDAMFSNNGVIGSTIDDAHGS